jgi:two-component system, chemotaxis family, chemotaxis protein CheY
MLARRILIADDNDSVRALLARVCVRMYGTVEITAVRDGAEALAALKKQPADLVITNANMPNLNGIELIRAVRAQHISVPMLMLSADATMEWPALAAGANRFLLKPPTLAMLQQTLIDLLAP